MNKPYIRSLNRNQYKLLAAIYSFRFSTRSLLSEYCEVPNNTSFYTRLQILLKHEYIASHYDKSYKLAGREAEYYLLPKGLRALREAGQLEATDQMITALYKDKSVGQDFIKHHTLLMRIRNQLVSAHDDIQVFTARDIQPLDYFPRPRPDLFISIKTKDSVARSFVEYIPASVPASKLRKRLEHLSLYYEDDTWDETGTPFPNMIFIAENKLVEASIRKLIGRENYRSSTDIVYYISNLSAVLNMKRDNAEVWEDARDTDEVVALSSM